MHEGDRGVSKNKDRRTGLAVRRALMSSAALAPLYFMSPQAVGQSVPTGPTADAGPDQTVADSDGLPGESITFDGSGSTPLNIEDPLTYVWTNAQGVQIAAGVQPSVRLPDGVNQITLAVSEDDGSTSESQTTLTAIDTVTITIGATSAPIANAGAARTVADTDGQPGEVVSLDGSASTDADGTIISYEWFRDNTPLGTSTTPVLNNVSLPDGVNNIRLLVRDNTGNTGSTATTITVGAAAEPPATPALATLELKPNELQVAKNLDDLSSRLDVADSGEGSDLTADQQDLLDRCNGVINNTDPAQQETALEQMGAEEMNAMRTQAVLFSRTQGEGVMDRLLALRSGQRGVSVAGLNLRIGDKYVPTQQIAASLRQLLGGGASADEPGGLFDNRLGMWMRGNYGIGEKKASAADQGFDSDQWGFTGGIDYRFSDATVAGISIGYGRSDVDFKPVGDGSLKTKSLTGSLYGSAYLGNFYFDGVFNYADADYDSDRHIIYDESGGTVDRNALGTAGGNSLCGGLSAGYDFAVGGFTISPTLGYFFVDTKIDSFAETGAGGLNLLYDEQQYESSTGNAGLRITYAWKTSWGVFIPHLRGTYVREFQDETEVFGVRFAADPFAGSSDPTPPIYVQSNEPDQSYFRLAAGMSAQFRYDISGYFEYQRLESFQFVDFQDFTVGLRIQHSFR
jgi:outer membrane autotransporter protein